MKLFSKRKAKAVIALLFSAMLLFSALCASADDGSADNAEKELEGKTSELEQQLSKINGDLLSISDEIALKQMQIEITNSEILRTEDSLKAAKADESERYYAMKSRIKYMYESGDSSLFGLLLSAKSMSDLINKADFVQYVTDYDRSMLKKLQGIRDGIASENLILKQQRASLTDLSAQLKERQAALKAAAEKTSVDLNKFYAQLEELRRIRAEEEARRAAEEARRRAEEERRRLEEEKRRLEEEKRLAEAKKNGGTVKPLGALSASHAPIKPADEKEFTLFAGILQAEAIADYDSMLAVATVVLNRVESPRFANTISEVIYSPGQFEPVWTGRLAQVLANGPIDLAKKVAQDALDGARLAKVADCYYFLYAPSTSRKGINIGDNMFFQIW